jgi:uncharacterized protein YjiS (DUF1127 family)
MTFVNAIRAALGSEAHRRIRQQRVTAQALRTLDDHILHDIGVLGQEMRTPARGRYGRARDWY